MQNLQSYGIVTSGFDYVPLNITLNAQMWSSTTSKSLGFTAMGIRGTDNFDARANKNNAIFQYLFARILDLP